MPGLEGQLLDVLEEYGVRATFFMQGRWVEAYPEMARRMADAHLIGNHSHYHCRMPLLTDEGIAADLRSAEAVLQHYLGIDPRPWFRCPFNSGADDPRVLQALEARGYLHIGADVVTRDWNPSRRASELVREVLAQIEGRQDSIVLFHTWPAVTAKALAALLSELSRTGAELVGVNEFDFPYPASVSS